MPPPNNGLGRFQEGKILFGKNDTIIELKVRANGFDSLFTDLGSINGIKCYFKGTISGTKTGNGTALIQNARSLPNGYEIMFKNLSVNLDLKLVKTMGIGSSNTLDTNSVLNGNNINKTVEILDEIKVPFKIIDDDDYGISAGISEDFLNNIYNQSYIHIANDGGGLKANNQIDLELPYNLRTQFEKDLLSINDWNKIDNFRQSKNYERDNYWVVHNITAYQSDYNMDSDPDFEYNYVQNGIAHDNSIGTIYDKLSDIYVGQGYENCALFKETIRETGDNISLVLAHELGHQFGLTHGDLVTVIKEYKKGRMGLMYNESITDKKLIPRHKNLIRSRIKTPGKK